MANPWINYEHLRRQIVHGHHVMIGGVEYSRVEDLPTCIPGHPKAKKDEDKPVAPPVEPPVAPPNSPDPAQVRKDLEALTVAKLLDLAANVGAEVKPGMRKAEIVEVILAKRLAPVAEPKAE
jgi:hypothetical protein